MSKNDCLSELESIKSKLYEQLNSIKYAINDENHTAAIKKLDENNCALCKMMKENVKFRSSNMGASLFSELKLLHTNLHDDYNKAIEILRTPSKKGLVSKLINSNKINNLELERLKSYYDDLGITVDATINMLEKIMRRVHALNESRWENQEALVEDEKNEANLTQNSQKDIDEDTWNETKE